MRIFSFKLNRNHYRGPIINFLLSISDNVSYAMDKDLTYFINVLLRVWNFIYQIISRQFLCIYTRNIFKFIKLYRLYVKPNEFTR